MRSALLAILVLASTLLASAQDPAQTAFVGTFTFSGFSVGGSSDVTGTINTFNDQTGQYFANAIQVDDVIWDNLGQRWRVAAVNSSSLLEADVDLEDQQSCTCVPFGLGFVSRETTNAGLSLFVPDNSTGISQQLKSRVESHNMLKLDTYLGGLSGGGGGAEKLMRPYDSGFGFLCYCTPGVVTTNPTTGEYTITIPDSTDVNRIMKNFTNAGAEYTAGGDAIVTVTWSAGSSEGFNTSWTTAMVPLIDLIDSGGNQRNPADVAVSVSTTQPALGSSVTTVANINGLGVPARLVIDY